MTVPEPVSVVAPGLPRPHLMRQHWRDVGFLHWAVPPASVAHLFPPGVRPDVLDGATYVGLVPFRMVGARFAHGPAVPWAGTFLETNVRLYSVDDTGRRGISRFAPFFLECPRECTQRPRGGAATCRGQGRNQSSAERDLAQPNILACALFVLLGCYRATSRLQARLAVRRGMGSRRVPRGPSDTAKAPELV